MNQSSVFTIAKWQVSQGQLSTVLELLKEATEKSRKEEGNILYKIHQSLTDDHTLLLYEEYRDASAVEAHRSSDHFKEIVLGKIIPLLSGREVVQAREIDFDE